MKSLGVLLLVAGVVLWGQEVTHDFKPSFAGLPAREQSVTVTATPGPAFLLSSDNMQGKQDSQAAYSTYTGHSFYIFKEEANSWRGKTIQATFDMMHLSGDVSVKAGFRVFGKDSKLLAANYSSITSTIDGKWYPFVIECAVPDIAEIGNINVNIGLYHSGNVTNAYVIDNLKIVRGMKSGVQKIEAASLGAASLLDKEPLDLVVDGVPTFTIMTGNNPDLIARYAAEELQYHVKAVTGHDVEILAEKDVAKAREAKIWIGDNSLSRRYQVYPDMMPQDNWVVARVGRNVLISGGDCKDLTEAVLFSRVTRPMGTLFATYEFLERVFGIRWFWPGEHGMVAPKARTVQLTHFFKQGTPAYACRYLFYCVTKEMPAKEVHRWHRRLRLGGADPSPIANHCFGNWADKYKDHPEYFALQANGQRKLNKNGGVHLCMTNPEVIRLITEEAVQFFTKHPDEKFFGVMPGDSNELYYCRCEACQKLLTPQRGHDGMASDAVWSHVNTIAAKLGKLMPGKYVKCCAYADYRMRPSFPLLPNVAVTLCCGSVPIGIESVKQYYKGVIDEWRGTGATLYVWDYWNDSRYNRGVYGAPAIYPRQVAEFYAIERGAVSGHAIELSDIDSNGDYVSSWADWLYDLPNLYIALKLQWDASLDVEDELERYYRDFFGPAQAQMREFYETLERAWLDSYYVLNCKRIWNHDVCWKRTYTPEMVDHLMVLLRKAVTLTEGQEPYDYRAKKMLQIYSAVERNSKMFRGYAEISKKNRNITLKTSGAPDVDGTLKDDEWKDAVVLKDFEDSYNIYPVESRTEVYLKQDGTNLYVGAKAFSPREHVEIRFSKETEGKRDTFLWLYESMELLFANKEGHLRQFIVAPDRLLFDAAWTDPNDNKSIQDASSHWNPPVTLKTSRKGNDWEMEIAIPLEVITFQDMPKNTFRVDFARNHYFKKNKADEFKWEQSIWLSTYGGFGNVDKYGVLTLEK